MIERSRYRQRRIPTKRRRQIAREAQTRGRHLDTDTNVGSSDAVMGGWRRALQVAYVTPPGLS